MRLQSCKEFGTERQGGGGGGGGRRGGVVGWGGGGEAGRSGRKLNVLLKTAILL